MVKLTIFFRQPADVNAFEDHFSNQHVPLISAMPGVYRSSVTRALGAPRGEPIFYLIHDVYFTDMPSLNYALNSPEGRAAGADLMSFARDIVTLMFAEVWGEDPFEQGIGHEPVPEDQPTNVANDALNDEVANDAANQIAPPVIEPVAEKVQEATDAPIEASSSEPPHDDGSPPAAHSPAAPAAPAATQTDTPAPAEHQHPPTPSPEGKPA